MNTSIFDFIYNNDNLINGIRILKFRKDVLLKNHFFNLKGNRNALDRLTSNPYEILPIEDMSNKRIDEINHQFTFEASKVWKNDTSMLSCTFNLLAHGDLVKADALFHNKVLYMNRKGSVIYYDEEKDEIKKISKSQIKKKLGYDENYHTIVILPEHMTYDYYEKKDQIKSFYNENLEKFNKLLDEREIDPIIKSLARIKFKSKSEFCTCEKDELVFIYAKGKLRDRFNVINEKGEIKQATGYQLRTLPGSEQNKEIQNAFLDKREKFLIKDQEEGIPLLLTIEHWQPKTALCQMSTGIYLNIPFSIIPSFNHNDPLVKEQKNHWIKVPKWFYKRYVEA